MDQIETLRTDGHALARAARTVDIDTPIAHCPGWSMGRLVGHTGKVLQRTELCVRLGLDAPPADDLSPKLPRDGSLFDVFDEIVDRLADTLAAADPAGSSWNFTGTDLTNAFWIRRMAHEVEIHRWDAQLATGSTPDAFASDDAVDGIDELLTVLIPVRSAIQNPELTGSFHLHCTDAPGEWLTIFTAGEPLTSREHAKGDIAVRGAASSLYLWAWNRLPASDDAIEVIGDDSLLEGWASIVP